VRIAVWGFCQQNGRRHQNTQMGNSKKRVTKERGSKEDHLKKKYECVTFSQSQYRRRDPTREVARTWVPEGVKTKPMQTTYITKKEREKKERRGCGPVKVQENCPWGVHRRTCAKTVRKTQPGLVVPG